MKKNYQKPFAELVEFNYADQVVAASDWSTNTGKNTCEDWTPTNTVGESGCYHN